MRAKAKRTIHEVLKWSPHCREHYFPWRSVTAGTNATDCISEGGVTEACRGYELGRIYPRSHLLLYTTHGSGEVYTERDTFAVRRGQVLLLPARLNFGYVPAEKFWRFVWFHLPESELWNTLKSGGVLLRKTLLTERIEAIADALIVESRGQSESHRGVVRLYAQLFVAYVERELLAHPSSVQPGMANRLDQLCAIVTADLKRPWTVEALAREVRVSAPYLYRLTKRHLGGSPMGLVTRLRMERAQEMLVMRSAKIADIASKVGYHNEFAFTVAFKRFAGVTPSKFRDFL
ncbi:MAG: AraC family transcriptional regulator [Candidatus Hydrogenedentes bacterium]|nr:AraC family transcriptional regulator [Candidatus Hydrogenedentota bacterium]